MTNYQQAKDKLRSYAEYVSVQYRGDTPLILQCINNYNHMICSDYKLSEYKTDLLHNYACKLHPK